jgi:hypothetical protein
MHFVPARRDMVNGTAVQSLRKMIVTVRNRVKKIADAGKTQPEIIAAHPTAEFVRAGDTAASSRMTSFTRYSRLANRKKRTTSRLSARNLYLGK